MRTHSSTALSVVAAAIVAASSVAAAPYDAELKQRYEAAKAEGKVVMYSVESLELIQELAAAFKARFPGIDFDFFRGDSTQIAQRFEAEAPKTWEDLLNPKWKGKIGMQDPKSGGGGAHAWVARMYQVYGEERWFEFMDKNGRPDRQVRPLFPDPRIARLG